MTEGAAAPGYGMPLAEVLRVPALAGTRVLAGSDGLDRVVDRLGVMEVPDVLPFVRRHEILLTTGYPIRDRPHVLADLVGALHDRGVAAFGVKIGRYLDAVPGPALERADALGFPVLELPADVSFDDVLREVLTGVLGRQAALLARAEEVHRRLLQVVLDGGGLPEVAGAVVRALGLAVLVTTPDGRVLAEAGDGADLHRARHGPWTGEGGRFRVESADGAVGRHDDGGRAGHVVVPVLAGGVDHGRIVAVSARRAPGEADVRALERAATVCALAVVKQLAVAAVEDRYQGDFLRDLLLGRAGPPERVLPHAVALGWDLDRPLVVVAAEPDDDPPPAGVDGLSLRPAVERLATAWRTVVRHHDVAAAVCGYTTEVVAVVGAPPDGDVERLVGDLVAEVRGDGGGGRRPFTAGIGRVARGVAELPAAYEQARTAVTVGRRVHGGGGVAHFDRLGIHRLLGLVPDGAELRAFLHETLGPLAAETAEAADLRHTLETLLDNNLNVAETARRLHFHYNSLRYRIAKLERLLGPLTADPNLRLDLAVALRIARMRGL